MPACNQRISKAMLQEVKVKHPASEGYRTSHVPRWPATIQFDDVDSTCQHTRNESTLSRRFMEYLNCHNTRRGWPLEWGYLTHRSRKVGGTPGWKRGRTPGQPVGGPRGGLAPQDGARTGPRGGLAPRDDTVGGPRDCR